MSDQNKIKTTNLSVVAEGGKTGKLSGVAKDVNDSIRDNESSLCVLEEQIDALTDALVSANADPIEIVGIYEEERAKLLHDVTEKSSVISELEKTISELQEGAKRKEEQYQHSVSELAEKGRTERDNLVEQLRNSQMELMDHYSKVDELDFALCTAEAKARVQNENLIDQNSALMNALQVEQHKSEDVIEDLERSLQKVSLDSNKEFEKDLQDLSVDMDNINPVFNSSLMVKDIKPVGSSLELLQKLKEKATKLEYNNKELVGIISSLEEELLKEDTYSKELESRCFKLQKELEHAQEGDVEGLEMELESTQRLLDASEEKVLELERVLFTTLNKHEALVEELNSTISSQDAQIEELKKKNFYPKLMDDLKKENSRLKDEVNKLNKLVKQTPTKKIEQLKNKFQQQEKEKTPERPAESEDKKYIRENLEIKHREEINHLKSKLVILEKKLNQSLEENCALNLELSEAIDQLDENSFNYETVIQDLQKRLNDSKFLDGDSNLNDSLQDIKQHLQKEKERNKNLSILLAEYENSEKADLPPHPPPTITLNEAPIDHSTPIKPAKSPKPPVAKKPQLPKPSTSNQSSSLDYEEWSEEKAALEEKISTMEREIHSLKIQVKRGVSVCVTPIPYKEVDQLEKELEDSQLDKEHLEETIDIISEEHEAQLTALNKQIECLKQELELKQDYNNDSLVEQLTVEKEKQSQLSNRVEELEFELNEIKGCDEESLNHLKDNLDEAEKMCEELMTSSRTNSTSEDVPVTLQDLKMVVKHKEARIKELESKNKDMQNEVDHLSKELADISTEISDADQQYSKKIDHLQELIESKKNEYRSDIQDLQDEIEVLTQQIDDEQHSGRAAHLEQENVKLIEECKTLTDKLASNILSKIAPNDERIDIIEEMKGQFEKGHARLKSEIDHKAKKIADLENELKRVQTNSNRKIASIKENSKIKEEQAELKVQEEMLTSDSLKEELSQLKKINSRYEINLSDKSREFGEVVTKLLYLENLIELQKDNLLAKDEQIQAINKQLDHLKDELDIAQQQQKILKQESIAVDELEISLNEVSEHERLLQEKVNALEQGLKKEKLVSDQLCKKQTSDFKEMNQLKKTLKASEATAESQLNKIEALEKTELQLMKKIERLENQNEELSEQENILSSQVNELFEEKNKLEEELTQLRVDGKDKEEMLAAEEFDSALKKRDDMIDELERSLVEKEVAIEKKTNDVNRLLNTQDKMKHDLVAKNIELERQYELLMEKFCDIEGEKDGLLEEIDNNFKGHTQTLNQLDTEVNELKEELARKDEIILEKDEEVNEMNAKTLTNSQSFFETRKKMEQTIMLLKSKLMDIEGGDAIRRTSLADSTNWLADTSNLNHIIGEKDKEILNLRESLKNSAKSPKQSCIDIDFDRKGSLRSIPPPTDMEIAGEYLPNDTIVIESYKSKIEKLLEVVDQKDAEYDRLAEKFTSELEGQVKDSNIYHTQIEKLQKMASLFLQENGQLITDNKNIIEKSSRGILDVNETLTDLTNELQKESEKTTELLGELDVLKEEFDNIKDTLSKSNQPEAYLQDALAKILTVEDNIEMAVEEHQCSLDQYQLLLQTYQQEILMIDEEINQIGPKTIKERCNDLDDILVQMVGVLADKLEMTKNDVTATQFRGSQVSEKENDLLIEQAKYKCARYDNEMKVMKRMLKGQEGDNMKDAMADLSVELLTLKDLLSLERKATPPVVTSQTMKNTLSEQRAEERKADFTPSGRTLIKDISHVDSSVNICEIDGLELVTHDLRASLRAKENECDELRTENDNMNSTLKHIQKEFGQMLSSRTVEFDVLNDTMSSERNLLEEKLERLAMKVESKESSAKTLKTSLSFEQGRVQQLKEDLETTYDTSFQHIKEYEGRVSTITERLNLQQMAVKAKLMETQDEVDELRCKYRDLKITLAEKESAIELIKIKHINEIKKKDAEMRQRAEDIEIVKEEAMRYIEQAEEVKRSLSQHGSYDAQITQYSDIMSKFRNEISEEKEAFQNSLQKLNFLVEDRTLKIKEYEQIVQELQTSLSQTRSELESNETLNETLRQEKDSLKIALLTQRNSKEDDKHRENEANLFKNKANKANQQVVQLKEALEDTKRRYEAQLSQRAEELLKSRLRLEKSEEELRQRAEENRAIREEVKALKLEIENAGSDNQVKDLEQKLAGALTEVEDASFRIQRYEREVSSLKDVLASLQSPADNDIAQKISEYETTVADYEVQVTMLKKNISDLHTRLHNTYDERQKVIEKAQAQISVYQRRLEQMNARVEEAQQTSKRDTEALAEAKKVHTEQVLIMERKLAALGQRGGKGERLMDRSLVLDGSGTKDIQQRFELAVKRADHLQEQVDTMRDSNKRIQKTVEDLWAENTNLVKELDNFKELQGRRTPLKRGDKSARSDHKKTADI